MSSPSIKSYMVAAVLVLCSSVTVTFWVWISARQDLSQDIKTTLSAGIKGTRDIVTTKVSVYSEALNGAAGLFQAMDGNVTKESWRRYITNLDAQNRYPGIQAIVYTEAVPIAELGTYEQARKLDTRPDYAIVPTDQKETYYPVRFIEPTTPENTALTGFDVSSEPIRQRTMMWARDTGQVSITSRLVLISDKNNKDSQPGFIIYVPVYAPNAAIGTVAERRAALLGFVSAGVRSQELIEGLFGKSLTKDSAARVYDGTKKTDQNIIYESAGYKDLVAQKGITMDETTISLGNNNWTLVGHVNNNVATGAQRNQPRIILYSGLIFSVMLSGLLLIIMISRARSIATEKNMEVQEAKDSLISLASHQLRTPATSVKQFIGMVLEGYAGKVPLEQKRMLQKAYTSNERQLEIINQILHVTRADSGRLVLQKEQLDLTKIVRDAIAEHAQSVLSRSQKVQFRRAKPILLFADKHYLAMAIDNLLSNASKYSPTNSEIKISIKDDEDEAIISVSDSGIGIDEKDMHRLFQKFSRIDNKMSVEAGGNGIGLYLVKQIVTLHGGHIDVTSDVGAGSTFTVHLPKH